MEGNLAFEHALLQMDRVEAADIFAQAYSETASFDVLEQMVTDALEKIGSGWESGQISLSQVYMSGILCEELIEDYLPKTGRGYLQQPRIAIGVLLDHHALGKRMVHSVLRSKGYQVIDFGHGLSVDELVDKTIEHSVDVLLISTLMVHSALKVANVIEQLRQKDCLIPVIVGGAPFRLDPGLWQKVQADADGKNASNVPRLIEDLMQGRA